jgi:GNAT superfamily N-acetyltransferase
VTTKVPIRTAAPDDAGRCVAVLTLAFHDDPPCRWGWPEPQQYLEAFPRFARAFGGGAIAAGTAHHAEGFAGAALWLPPGTPPDEETLVKIFEETLAPDRKSPMFSMFEQMGAYHPHEPHWHLPLIGVDPTMRGIGSALLSHALERCDREGLPAYLEATSPKNVPLYERHGFVALGRIQVADSPPVIPMLRKAR